MANKEFKAGDSTLTVRTLSWGERKKAKKDGLFKKLDDMKTGTDDFEELVEEVLALVLNKKEMALIDKLSFDEVVDAYRIVLGVAGPEDAKEEKN